MCIRDRYHDDYYPAFLVNKVKDELQKVIDLLESGETDTDAVQDVYKRQVLAHIDVILSAAMEDWNNTTNHAALRCPPMTVSYTHLDVYKRQAWML